MFRGKKQLRQRSKLTTNAVRDQKIKRSIDHASFKNWLIKQQEAYIKQSIEPYIEKSLSKKQILLFLKVKLFCIGLTERDSIGYAL